MISKPVIFLLFAFISIQSFSQTITNLVMVGPGGVTEDLKKATAFIVVKQYPDSHFERLDYKIGGPLVKLRSYKDQELTILDGRYFEYAVNGTISVSGKYSNSLRDGKWNTYNDTGKVIKSIRYANDSIVENIDLNIIDSVISYPDEKEASFPGGDKAWMKYLIKKLGKDNPADKSFNGGKVYINFIVGSDGSVEESYVSKSVEYILDETSLNIIASAPKWNPAFQNGKTVRAYRRQPLTFVKQ